MHDQSHIRILFERHGLRCTRQRELLYQALASTKCHPTADELFKTVKEQGLSLATVYNTLDAFTEVGLVRRLPPSHSSGPCRFDADTTDHVHVATSDGQIHDVPDDLSRQLLANISPQAVADLERRMNIRVRGLTVQVSAHPSAGAQSPRRGRAIPALFAASPPIPTPPAP